MNLTRMHLSMMRTARSSSRLLGGCLPQCMLGYTHPLAVGLETHPQVWAWRPPRPDPSTFPLGVGQETPPQARPFNFPPGCGPGDPPQARPLNFPPGCGPGDPPRPDPSTFPPGCRPGDPPDQTPQLPPWVWAWRPARHAWIPPLPCEQND